MNSRNPFGQSAAKTHRWAFYVALIIGSYMFLGHPMLMDWFETKLSYQAEAMVIEKEVDRSAEMFAAKIDALKDEVVADLEKCESGGRKEEDGIVVLDTNNKGSYGVMQWQRTSVQHYYKKMTGQEINGRDAIILALTAEKARELAKWTIFETENGVARDWVNCARWHGLQERVEMIKKLEK